MKKPKTKTYSNAKKEQHKIYNSVKWQRLRLSKLQQCPVCERCGVALAEEVHHRIPFMQFRDELKRKEMAYDYDNLMSVCKECHIQIHKELKKNQL